MTPYHAFNRLALISGAKLPGTKPLAAEIIYREGTRTETFVHGVRIVFWVPGGSHTIGDLIVHLPDDQVLLAGDILVSGVVPTLQDGFLKNWIQTLEDMQALDVTHFVPGHGDIMTRDDVAGLRNVMSRFYWTLGNDSGTVSQDAIRNARSFDLGEAGSLVRDWRKHSRVLETRRLASALTPSGHASRPQARVCAGTRTRRPAPPSGWGVPTGR